MTTATDQVRLADAMVDVWSAPQPRATKIYCPKGVAGLGALGFTRLIERIADCTDGPTRLRRARLLAQASGMRMPHGPAFWRTAGDDAIQAELAEWRRRLAARGLVSAPSADADSSGLMVENQDRSGSAGPPESAAIDDPTAGHHERDD